MLLARILAVSVTTCLAVTSCSDDAGPIDGHEVREFAESGVNQHVEGDVEYEQSPPVTGPHSAEVLPCDAFTEIVPEEPMVHTLEHGAVGILFGPEIAAGDRAAIAEYVEGSGQGSGNKVFSAPFPGLRNPVIVVSWGRMMPLASFDADVVDEYVARYENDAPEPEVECP